MSTFTLLHVLISLIGIGSGLVVMYGFVAGRRLPRWNAVFLVMTILTSVTGFFFTFRGITPGIVVGVVSLVVMAGALLARSEKSTKTYIVMVTIAEFLNVLVLIVQSFEKIPALHALAPQGTEPITNVVKGLALVLFVVVAWVAVKRGRFVLR
jgi:hypothetical protein